MIGRHEMMLALKRSGHSERADADAHAAVWRCRMTIWTQASGVSGLVRQGPTPIGRTPDDPPAPREEPPKGRTRAQLVAAIEAGAEAARAEYLRKLDELDAINARRWRRRLAAAEDEP